MAGLLDFLNTPEGAGLLSAVAGGMAGARRGTPVNNIGKAGLAGLLGYTNAQSDITKNKQYEDSQKMQELQRQVLAGQLQDATKQRELTTSIGQAARDSYIPGQPESTQFKTPLILQDTPPEMPGITGALPNLPGAFTQQPKQYDLTAETRPATPGGFNQSAFLDRVRSIDPIKAMEYEAQFKKNSAPIKLGKDDRLIDPISNKEILGAAPEKIDYNKAFLPDGSPNLPFQEYSHKNRRAGAPNTQVIMPTQEKEQSKEYGKSMGELRGQINKSGFEAPSKLAQLQRMEQLLDGVDGGKLAPLGAELASAAQSFGIKIDGKLGNKEAAEALTREIASGLRKPGTGPMTDKDFDNFMMQVPSLSKTPEGRKQITATLRAAVQRDIEAAKFMRAYAKKNGGVIDDAFFDQLAEWYSQNPVIATNQAQPTITDIQAEIMRRQGKK